MEESTTNAVSSVATGAVNFIKDGVMPLATEMVKWIISTEGVKEFFYISLAGCIIGLVNHLRRS